MKLNTRMPKSMRFCSRSIGKALRRWTRKPCECPACVLAASSGLWGPWQSSRQLTAQRWPGAGRGGGVGGTTVWSPLQQQQQTQNNEIWRCSGTFFHKVASISPVWFSLISLFFSNDLMIVRILPRAKCTVISVSYGVFFKKKNSNKTSKQTHKENDYKHFRNTWNV